MSSSTKRLSEPVAMKVGKIGKQGILLLSATCDITSWVHVVYGRSWAVTLALRTKHIEIYGRLILFCGYSNLVIGHNVFILHICYQGSTDFSQLLSSNRSIFLYLLRRRYLRQPNGFWCYDRLDALSEQMFWFKHIIIRCMLILFLPCVSQPRKHSEVLLRSAHYSNYRGLVHAPL